MVGSSTFNGARWCGVGGDGGVGRCVVVWVINVYGGVVVWGRGVAWGVGWSWTGFWGGAGGRGGPGGARGRPEPVSS